MGIGGSIVVANVGKYYKVEILGSVENFGACIYACVVYLYVFIYIKTVVFAFIQHLIIQSGIAWQELTITF